MSSQKLRVLVPPLRSVPPDALWLGNLAASMLGIAVTAIRLVSAARQKNRARRQAERVARRQARAREELIALARQYESTQPSFAKDLFAAAADDRHCAGRAR